MLNELFRPYRKIIYVVLILLCSIVFWFFGCHRQPKENTDMVTWEKESYEHGGYGYNFRMNDLSGNVVFGVRGYTVKDEDIPITLHLTSDTKDFSGLVNVIVPGTGGTGI
ncbi:MAG: hypothetical protein IKX76_00875, partial [Eubacterium sp.]|nr:hypothetical protein [Eubacterium sp.]